MQNIPGVFEDLREYLRNNHNGKPASGGKEIVIRCPFCGDSRDIKDAHLYVGINRKRNDAISYNCFKCGIGGFVDGKFFREIRCTDTNLINNVLDYNKSRWDNTEYIQKYNARYNPVIDNRINTDIDRMKIDYFNQRLGVQCTQEDLIQFKVVLSLYNFLNANNVRELTRKQKPADELNFNCIGFLSMDNSYIVERYIGEIPKNSFIGRRYTNYKILDNPYGVVYYVIPSMVDVNRDIHIHIAEGSFDILGVYFHVVQNHDNCIFVASMNKSSYLDAIKYTLSQLQIVPCMVTVDIYLDKEDDGSLNTRRYSSVVKELKEWVQSVTLHYNDFPEEKDFGVPSNRIKDVRIQ